MRSMEEDVVEALDMSFEQLRMSDTETEDNVLKENTGIFSTVKLYWHKNSLQYPAENDEHISVFPPACL